MSKKKKKSADLTIPRVTDHALVRYLERVHNIDVEALRNHILTKERKGLIILGAVKIPFEENGKKFKLAISNNQVSTILE